MIATQAQTAIDARGKKVVPLTGTSDVTVGDVIRFCPVALGDGVFAVTRAGSEKYFVVCPGSLRCKGATSQKVFAVAAGQGDADGGSALPFLFLRLLFFFIRFGVRLGVISAERCRASTQEGRRSHQDACLETVRAEVSFH